MLDNSVAVIIPTHNRWPLVCDAIDSVLSQTNARVECIVIDDASTDDTPDLLRKKYGDKITLLCNDVNREKSYSRNRGIRAAQSKFVCFLDSDDVFVPDSIFSRLSVFIQDPDFDGVAFGVCRPKEISANDEEQLFRYLEENNPLSLDSYIQNKKTICTNSYLLKKDNMLKFGMYNERLTNREDIELFIRLFCKLSFQFCGRHVGYVRPVAENRARDQWEKMAVQQNVLCDELQSNEEVEGALGDNINAMLLDGYLELLTALYRAGKYREFISSYHAIKQLRGVDKLNSSKYIKRYFISCIFQFKELLWKGNGAKDCAQMSFSQICLNNKKYVSSCRAIYKSLLLDNSSLKELLNDEALTSFVSNANMIKDEGGRKVFVGELSTGENVFCKLYIESGVYAVLRRLLLGGRALLSHYQSQDFSATGQSTPISLGCISKRVKFCHWESYHFCTFVANAQTMVDALTQTTSDHELSREYLLEGLAISLAALHKKHYVHGDVKLNNIILSGEEVFFVDLDSFGKVSDKRSFSRDVARLLVGLSEVGVSKDGMDFVYKKYCMEAAVDDVDFMEALLPLIERFQEKHKEKYGRMPADIF